ncbi:MAG TPA: trans-aconitate 2-methyltransferase [Vicinamibacteria bacterium]|nr:trans-aconitate 2-methyltransferase [Vicinamibacteria bacterium]
MTAWSPEQYLRFADERTRPARDLLAQVPASSPARIYDLGCGPGNSTALLREAYPSAKIVGIDNSEEMLAEARRALPSCTFVLADLGRWLPENTADLLFSNAAFHWIPDHVEILKRLATKLGRGGVLAVQMPDNLDEPSHRLMQETAAGGPWSNKLGNADGARAVLLSPQRYYDVLRSVCSRVEIWHTIYNHPLDGAKAIVDFMGSTALRPFLGPLDEEERARFLADYTDRVAKAYPVGPDGRALLRFPRLFIVAAK